jgi:transposase-like protein
MYPKQGCDTGNIELCVRWCITYRRSYRNLVEMMAERSIELTHCIP